MKPEEEAKLTLVLDRFDFKSVSRTMAKLDWTWVDIGMGIPTAVDLRKTASILLKDAYEVKDSYEGNGYCASGGLVARYEDGEFSLEFVLEDSDSFDYNYRKRKIDKVPKPLFKSSILSLSLQE